VRTIKGGKSVRTCQMECHLPGRLEVPVQISGTGALGYTVWTMGTVGKDAFPRDDGRHLGSRVFDGLKEGTPFVFAMWAVRGTWR